MKWPRKDPVKRFFMKIEKTGSCWIWKGGIFSGTGYGFMSLNDRTVSAHRYSWIIHNGEIPKGMQICHKCDNRKCVNPEHLFLGSIKDNVADCVNKKRHAFGERTANAKLTDKEVLEIRASQDQRKDLANRFGVYKSTITKIKAGLTWKHI